MLRTTRGRQSLPWKPAAFGVGVLGGLGLGYYLVHREPVPITGRKRFLNLTRQHELRLGKTAFEQVQRESRKLIVQDNKKTIEEILARLSKSSGIEGFKDTKWNVLVINNPTPNAFVLPGGYCVVFTGIFKVAKNVDGLATVLSHEAAHVLARHGAERVSKSFVLLPFLLLASAFFGIPVSRVAVCVCSF
jgi:predicted Zn-dependent protease